MDLTNAYVIAGAIAVLVATIGASATDVGPWYRALSKPSWNPPDWLFGPAWTTIYAVTVWAAGTAWYATPEDQRAAVILWPFAVNTILNILWSVVFFTLKRPDWAVVEVIALWLSTAWLAVAVSPYSTKAVWLLSIYLGWVTFAAILNVAIWRRNPNAHQSLPS